MENFIFPILFFAYVCLWTGLYVIYFIGAFELIRPKLIYIMKDKDSADFIFFPIFWFAAGLFLVVVALSIMDDVVLWINNPWLNTICNGNI